MRDKVKGKNNRLIDVRYVNSIISKLKEVYIT